MRKKGGKTITHPDGSFLVESACSERKKKKTDGQKKEKQKKSKHTLSSEPPRQSLLVPSWACNSNHDLR